MLRNSLSIDGMDVVAKEPRLRSGFGREGLHVVCRSCCLWLHSLGVVRLCRSHTQVLKRGKDCRPLAWWFRAQGSLVKDIFTGLKGCLDIFPRRHNELYSLEPRQVLDVIQRLAQKARHTKAR